MIKKVSTIVIDRDYLKEMYNHTTYYFFGIPVYVIKHECSYGLSKTKTNA